MELLYARFPSLSFFKTNVRIFRISFSENTSTILLLFFTEDGPAYWRKMMTSDNDAYLRQKHNVVFAERRVGTTLSMVSPQFRAQRRTLTTTTVNLIPYRADYFGHKLHIDQNENLKVCCLRFRLKLLIYKQLRLSSLNYLY